ncbi:MAG: bifunctional proline dehydrogenase/L-glutamate gamma-semialdehyde dehydrogenase PutA [Pseudomonadales bacterium]|nr:bifunctional proline dehydrogenase/L-glutamate gamma-semialdehyde dehydrogenase PutA [Pseudomonadales bacterium]
MLPDILHRIDPSKSAISASYREPEASVLARLLPLATLTSSQNQNVNRMAYQLAQVIRESATPHIGIQNILSEFALSSREGIVLMCLAEALLRVPDEATADRLIRDKLLDGDWSSHLGKKESLFVNASAWGLLLSGKVVGFNQGEPDVNFGVLKKVVGRLGEPVIRAAMKQALRVMGTQFVLGRTIEEALVSAKKQEDKGYCYSYDMLGEAARTMADADAYEKSYRRAIEQIGRTSKGNNLSQNAGVSVKLSALHPRYEFAQTQRIMTELLPRLKSLALLAKQKNIGFTIDAEESYRLALSLDLIEQLFSDHDLAGWDGFGMAIQAYQKRGVEVVRWVVELCRRTDKKMRVRLVKGAYWDTEIKLSQQEGQPDYPVFTRKASTDVSYQACAKILLANRKLLYPQFATHNAYTVALVLELAGTTDGFEFQRLHGMGEHLYEYLLKQHQVPCRIYAPVGEHEDLLAYLVRRLLENGANNSFVNNILDDQVPIVALVQDPVAKVKSWVQKANPKIPLPGNLYGNERVNSPGFDLTEVNALYAFKDSFDAWCESNIQHHQDLGSEDFQWSINPANHEEVLGKVPRTPVDAFDQKLSLSLVAFQDWSSRAVSDRVSCLNRLADNLEQHRHELMTLCIKEGGKTLKDSVAEVREAIDFCRYYAQQAQLMAIEHGDRLSPRGIILCISPWNFPLAIFLGQITAAIAAGSSVIAKPSGQTLLIAQRTVKLIRQSGFPQELVQLVNCPGRVVGEYLIPNPRIQAVMFTGSTATGNWIARKLSERAGEPIPLIAETGGQNCMLVDSTALPEQVVDDVISSGFQSAGQRCSALRVLFLQEEVADRVIDMLIGAMREIRVGDPSWLWTDVGPVIDANALVALNAHVEAMQGQGKLLYQCELTEECARGTFFAPRLYEIKYIHQLKEEVFGPVVHLIRYQAADLEEVFNAINSTGYGLTFGVHSRIQTMANEAIGKVKAGNIYINRNIIGAMVGVQPFGGQGLSGTGPKAGGPFYLYRLMRQLPSGVNRGAAVQLPKQIDRNIRGFAQPLSRLQANFDDWHRRLVIQRSDLLNAVIDAVSSTDIGSELHGQLQPYRIVAEEIIRRQQSPMTLTGPTGETNQLFYESRGVLLSLSLNKDKKPCMAFMTQVLAALLAGNTVLHLALVEDTCIELLTRLINQININNNNIIEAIPISLCEEDLHQLIQQNEIAGVLVQSNEEGVQWLNRMLRQRTGAQLPLITETSEPLLSKRLLLEKVVSTNTTAAGGNASLLTIDDN